MIGSRKKTYTVGFSHKKGAKPGISIFRFKTCLLVEEGEIALELYRMMRNLGKDKVEFQIDDDYQEERLISFCEEIAKRENIKTPLPPGAENENIAEHNIYDESLEHIKGYYKIIPVKEAMAMMKSNHDLEKYKVMWGELVGLIEKHYYNDNQFSELTKNYMRCLIKKVEHLEQKHRLGGE